MNTDKNNYKRVMALFKCLLWLIEEAADSHDELIGIRMTFNSSEYVPRVVGSDNFILKKII